jgi:hypothetical protein
MSVVQEVFTIAKKILLVSEQIDRLAEDVKSLSSSVSDHEIRLVRIETTLEIARRPSGLTLPGN